MATLNNPSDAPAPSNQADTSVVPQELVSRISFDYNQLVIGFVCMKLDELAAQLTDGDVAVGRRRALIDVLNYLESVPRLNKQYRVDVVSQIQVTDMALKAQKPSTGHSEPSKPNQEKEK